MAEKKPIIGIGDEKPKDVLSFAPLSLYDDLAARETEDLCRTSETLSQEMKTLTFELAQMKEQLEIGSQKECLQLLRAEQTLHEEKILELQKKLPLLREESASFRFDTDPSLIEEETVRISAQVEELRGKRENMSMELQLMEKETVVCKKSIAESEEELMEIAHAIKEMEVREDPLSAGVTELKRFETALPDDKAVESERAYYFEVAALGDGLKIKDAQALAKAQQLVVGLDQEYETPGEELSELMRHLNMRLSLMREVAEKEQVAASRVAEAEELQGKIAGKNASLEELRALNSEDKRMVAALEAEIHRYRKISADYAEEVSEGDEMSRKKEAAGSEFVALFVHKAELQERALTAGSKLRSLREMVRDRT